MDAEQQTQSVLSKNVVIRAGKGTVGLLNSISKERGPDYATRAYLYARFRQTHQLFNILIDGVLEVSGPISPDFDSGLEVLRRMASTQLQETTMCALSVPHWTEQNTSDFVACALSVLDAMWLDEGKPEMVGMAQSGQAYPDSATQH